MVWLLTEWLLTPPLEFVKVMAAAFCCLAFDAYLRPSEALNLTRAAVGRPRRAAAACRWSLTIAPRPGQVPAKNRTFDAGVVVGGFDRMWVADRVLAPLMSDLPVGTSLFRSLDLHSLEALFVEASKDLAFKIVPHGLRHAGPSHDAVVHKAAVHDLQCRGRWLSIESCRVYTKPAALLRSVGLLSDSQLRQARRFSGHLPNTLSSSLKQVLRNPGSFGRLKRNSRSRY